MFYSISTKCIILILYVPQFVKEMEIYIMLLRSLGLLLVPIIFSMLLQYGMEAYNDVMKRR